MIVVVWCNTCSPLVTVDGATANPHAPSEEGELWRNNTLLTGGCPALWQAVIVQWNTEIPPTDEKQPLAPISTPTEIILITGN